MNLKERFGRRYRVLYEESYCAERGNAARADDPWLQIIPCRLGHIFPWGGNKLAASTNTRGPTARKLAALDFTITAQDGDDGLIVVFTVEHFPKVAKILHPHRRPQMTEAQKAAGFERLAKYAFSPAAKRPGEGLVCDELANTLNSPPEKKAVLLPVETHMIGTSWQSACATFWPSIA